MKFKNAVFYKSIGLAMAEVQFEDKNEIVFVGRSNVGKSSLMNSLFGRKGLVKTSSKPGKTRQANIFLVNKKHFFTDLPGYGFAKLGKDLKEKLDGLISWYLETKKNCIKKVVMLVDSKLGPQKSDEEMFEYILGLGLPLVIVLTKMDKLGNMDRKKSLNYTSKIFFGQEIIPTSTVKKLGITELEKSINKSLS